MKRLQPIKGIEVESDDENHLIVVSAHIGTHPQVKKTIARVNACKRIPIFPEVYRPIPLI